MNISIEEFRSGFDRYLDMAAYEDIYIHESGRLLAKLSDPSGDRVKTAESLIGIIPSDMDIEDIKNERTGKI